jgi:hypothetical protein
MSHPARSGINRLVRNPMSDFYVGRFFYVRVSVTVQKERSELRSSE